MTRLLATVLCCTLFLCASQSQAVLIDQYNFDDGTINDSSGNATGLNNLGVTGAAPDLSGGSYHSDGVAANRIEVLGGAGAPDFTVSVWVKGALDHHGDFQGIFSNNTSSGAANSWQIDSHNGQYRVVSNSGISAVLGDARANEWDHIVLQKFGGNNGRVFLNGVQVGGNLGTNPGGLQAYRVGINRNSDNNNSFLGLIDNVQIFNDSTTSAAALFAAGPGTVDPRPVAALDYDANKDFNANNVAEDQVGFLGRNATLNNVATVTTNQSDAPQAYSFDGSTSTANFGNFETLVGNPTDASTSFEIIWRSPSLTGEQVLFEIGGGGDGMSLTLDGNDLRLVAKDGGNSDSIVADLGTLGSAVQQGNFLHTVAVVDIDGGVLQLYADGELLGEVATSILDYAGGNAGGFGSAISDTGGHNGDLGALNQIDFFTGEIAAFRVYGGALTAEDVELLAEPFKIVPEPATGLLLLLTSGAFMRRRRETA